MRLGLAPVRQLPRKQVDHLLDVDGRRAPHLRRLPRHFRAKCRDRTTGFNGRDVFRGQVRLHHRLQCLPWWSCSRHACRQRHRFGASTIPCFSEQRIARIEVRVETAVRQASLLHDVSDASTAIAGAPNRARGDFHDTLVRFLFTTWQLARGSFLRHDDHHIPVFRNVHKDSTGTADIMTGSQQNL